MTLVRILSVSDYESVRVSRELLLKNSGYSVVSMSSDRALSEEIPADVEVAIIGQSINDSTASRIAATLRRTQANVRILRLTDLQMPCDSGFDAVCPVALGPEVLLNRVVKLCEGI